MKNYSAPLFPIYKIRRWCKSVLETIVDFLTITVFALLFAVVWYLVFFR